MNNNEYIQNNIPIEFITEKFGQIGNSPIAKYFFLYFLYQLELFSYQEDSEICTFYNNEYSFCLPLPIIDTEEKYEELNKINQSFEKIFEEIKIKFINSDTKEIKLLEDI